MGRASNRKRREPNDDAWRAGPPPGWMPQADATQGTVIWAESLPRALDEDPDAPVRCRLVWGDWSATVTAERLLGMAEMLNQAAAQADLLKALMEPPFLFDLHHVHGLSQLLLRAGGEADNGVLTICPGVARTGRVTMVLVRTPDGRFGPLGPASARQMAVDWAQIARASVVDELFHESMRDVAGLDLVTRNAVMRYVRLIGEARRGREEVRAAQLAELRAACGLPPMGPAAGAE